MMRGAWVGLPVVMLMLLAGAPVALAQDAPEKVADAKPGDVRLFVSNGLREPFKSVRADAQTHLGRHLVVEYGSSRVMQAQMEADQPFDVAILTATAIADLAAKGKIVPGSVVPVARVPVAIAVRGVERIDVSTPGAIKAALMGARTVGYTPIGGEAPTVNKLFAALDIVEPMKAKFHAMPPVGDTSPMPPPGQYDLILNLVSEVLPLGGGWIYVGDTPDSLSVPVVMSAGIGGHGDAATAKKLIAFLQGPAIEPALKANHMTH
jgi:molybdate transport system substrate-binding protein